jgi:protein TonB
MGVHAMVVCALLVLSPQMPNSETSIAMEMVLPPSNNTPQPKPQRQLSVKSSASTVTQTPTASSDSEALPATTSDTNDRHTQATPALSLPSAQAQGLNNPKPAYPKLSRRLNEQGQVVLRVYVGADGSAQQVEIKTSSGYDRLDQEALRTVLRWRFVPGQRLGTPQAMWFNLPVNFVLE